MYTGRDFDPADPGEIEYFAFDFKRDVRESEVLNAAIWTCAVKTGTDADPASHIISGAVIVGTITQQKVSGLVAGVTYRLTATVQTNHGQILMLWSHVECRAPN